MNFKELVRLGKGAVVRSTAAGKSVTGFTAAFDSGWGDNKKTVWLDCSAWGDRYEKVAPYLLKGSQIVVAGTIGTREHEGKTYITLDVADIKLCAKPDQQQAARKQPAHTHQPSGGFDEDCPFNRIPAALSVAV